MMDDDAGARKLRCTLQYKSTQSLNKMPPRNLIIAEKKLY